MPIHHQFVYPTPILYQSANPSPICQFITYLSIHHQPTNLMPICQSNANLVILDQSNANPYQICQSITNSSIQPISANHKNRTVTDRQDIGTHWHRSRQSRASAADNRGPFHTDTDRHSIDTQSGTNQEPIGNQSVRTL